MLILGTAGWRVPSNLGDRFPDSGSQLARYAAVFNGTEINSSFHRPHRTSTYLRWGASVPDAFRFAVKLPKAITHAPTRCHRQAIGQLILKNNGSADNGLLLKSMSRVEAERGIP